MTTATVKFAAGEPRETKNGPRINAVLTIDETGEEVRIWGKPGEQPVASWQKNQKVQLEKNGQYWNPAKGATAAHQATQAQSAPQQSAPALTRVDLDNKEQRQALLAKGQHLADIYREVMRRLAEGDPADPLDTYKMRPEDVQAATATVFIQLMRNA